MHSHIKIEKAGVSPFALLYFVFDLFTIIKLVTGEMKSYKESNDENNLEDFAEVQLKGSHNLL